MPFEFPMAHSHSQTSTGRVPQITDSFPDTPFSFGTLASFQARFRAVVQVAHGTTEVEARKHSRA